MVFSENEKLITDAVNAWSDTVFRIAYQYARNKSDAEDILQEVFLKLLEKPPRLIKGNAAEALKAWLIRVTINKSRDFLRAEKRRKKVMGGFEPSAPQDGHSEVFEALFRLPERDRNAVYLHYYEGYTAREIAGLLGGNERAVTKRICRAREKLRRFLGE